MRKIYLIGLGAAILLVGAVAVIPMASGAATATEGFASPMPSGYDLGGLSCTGPGDCTAVGANGPYGEPVYETDTNGTWGPGTVIPVSEPEGVGSSLGFVSCTDSLDCTAVGSDPSGQIAITESDGTWGPLTVIVPTGEGGLSGMSCTGAGDCTAVGQVDSPSGNGLIPIIVTQSGGTWGAPVAAQFPQLSEATDNNGQEFTVESTEAYLTGVSCAPNGCTAVGSVQYLGPNGSGEAASFNLYATEVDGAWSSIVFSPIPTSSGVSSLSCTGAGDCTAIVGQNSTVTETNGTWGSVTPFADDGQDITSISCSDALDCTVVAADNDEPTYAIETDGTWGPLTEDFVPIDPGIGIVAGFEDVSCSDAADCTAIGDITTAGSDPIIATTFDPGGAITLGKSSGLIGNYVETVSGTGWTAKGDTSVTLNECATTYYTALSCDSTNQVGPVGVTKRGKFSNALITLAVGSIDTNDDTCGLAGSNPCYLVVTGSTGDWTSSTALSFKVPKATLTNSTAVASNYVDDVTATHFPIGDTVTAQECDSSVNPATNLATNCDTAKIISGTVGSTGTVTFSPAGVKVKVGAGYVETGTGTVVKGGTADIVVNDSTTSGISVVIPITLATSRR